jgi:hypothetical protein
MSKRRKPSRSPFKRAQEAILKVDDLAHRQHLLFWLARLNAELAPLNERGREDLPEVVLREFSDRLSRIADLYQKRREQGLNVGEFVL